MKASDAVIVVLRANGAFMTAKDIGAALRKRARDARQSVEGLSHDYVKQVLRAMVRDRVLLAAGATAARVFGLPGMTIPKSAQTTRCQVSGIAKATPRRPKPVPKPLAADKPAPMTPGTAEFESVEAFLARGGRIQKLVTGVLANPLRFDHSVPARDATHRRGRTSRKRSAAA